ASRSLMVPDSPQDATRDPGAEATGPASRRERRSPAQVQCVRRPREVTMSYEYQPKYPRAKLREIVTKYMTAMRTMGRRPNCSVAFATEEGAETAARVDAWLLRDP